MQSVTIYEKRDGDVEIQYGNNTAEVNEAIRSLNTRVEGATMNVLVNGDIKEVKSLARRILAENKEFLVDIWQNKQAEKKSNTMPMRASKDDDDMRQTEPGMYFGVCNLAR